MELEKARQTYFRQAQRMGSICPCCDRWGKINPYKLNSSMARGLIFLYKWHERHGFGVFCHLPTLANRSVLTNNSMGKMRHWGFVERQVDPETGRDKSGRYRLTADGKAFVRGEVWVSNKIWIYNDRVVDRAVETIGIKDALGVKFNYDEMMADTWRDE